MWEVLAGLHRRAAPSLRRRVRFRQAVPTRGDRHQLRRAFRGILRGDRADERRALTDELLRLAQDRVAVARIESGIGDDREVVHFADGTRLVLQVRDGSVALQRVGRAVQRDWVYLERARPYFGSSWCRVRFSVRGTHEILAKVSSVVQGPGVPARPRPNHHRRPAGGSV